MYPNREEALDLLKEAEKLNPGPWGNHSRTVAHCAERIAALSSMNPDKAYVLGLLHDIGRRFGKRHLGHVSDEQKIEGYVGNFDTTEEETNVIKTKLQEVQFDEYDKLIQLCDAISGAEGVMNIVDRMNDVRMRYGAYDLDKWNTNLALKDYFEQKMGKDLYEAVKKDSFKPYSE